MANYRSRPTAAPDPTQAPAATLTQRVYDAIREEIVAGALQPGQRLVRRELSKRLGVSPIPITEALLRLEVEGLVQSRPLYGCRVRPLSLEDVQNDEMLREAIECQAARLCAENASEEDLTRLMSIAKTLDRMMTEGAPRSKIGMQAHREFHTEVARAGKYPRLAEELQHVWFRRLMRLNWVKATHYQRVPADWHQRLVRLFAAHDADAAEAAMREHVRYGREDDCAALEFVLKQWSDAEIATGPV